MDGKEAYNEQLPTVGWKGQQTMPQELALRTVAGRPVLVLGGVHSASAALSADGTLHLRLVVDHSSLEVFTTDGQVAVTVQIYPDANSDGIRLFADRGDVTLAWARLTRLGAHPQ
jgi:hypothetical protein